MSDKMTNQSSDSANSSGFGTNQLSTRQPDVLKSNSLQDGGASNKGQKEPEDKTGVR